MGRWIAIGKAPGWDDQKRFSEEMKATEQWRIDPKSTITSVYALGDGRMIAECHATSQAEFDEWLKKKGWQVESITPIKLVAKSGDIWKV
jgi:flavodoxin